MAVLSNNLSRTVTALFIILLAALKLSETCHCAEEHIILDANFNLGQVEKGLRTKKQPAGWEYTAWNSEIPAQIPGGMSTQFCKSGKSLEIPAIEKGMAGWHSIYQNAMKPARTFTITGWIRCSKDYTGNIPRVFITWFKKHKYLSPSILGHPKCVPGKWIYFKYDLESANMPKEADRFMLNLVTTRDKKADKTGGQVFYDEVKLSVPVNDASRIKMRALQFANWWTTGNPVVFKPNNYFPRHSYKNVIGKIYGPLNQHLTSVSTPIRQVNRYGWIWQPDQPGFYKVRFFLQDSKGSETALTEEYIIPEWNRRQRKLFIRDYHNIAVAPCHPRKASLVSPMFGFNGMSSKYSSLSRTGAELCLANLLESNFIRFHMVKWLDIEPEKGKFDWENLDRDIKSCELYGMKPILNFFGTPQWASPHPEEVMRDICVTRYSAYAPNEMNDWTNFVKTMVTRYKDRVDTWEIWNEQHFPDSTCFWNDTPENFVKLLKAGYETIKAVQPKSTVWIGGMGNRYLPYYDKIMSLGAGKYFDKLVFHGYGPIPEPFMKINDKYNIPRHKWVNSEWHAFLTRFAMPELYKLHNDITLSRRMLKSMMQQINDGCEQIAMFEMMNIAEWESLGFRAKNGDWSTHCSGMFRTQPYLEPRFQAIAWRNFSANFTGEIEVTGKHLFGDQKVVSMKSGLGKLLVVWHEKEEHQDLDKNIAKALTDKTNITDWQGRKIDINKFKLETNTMYYIANPSNETAKWTQAEGVLSPFRKRLKLEGPEGKYSTAGFINSANGLLSGKPQVWNETNWQTNGESSHTGSRFALAFTDNGLDLVVEAIDEKHFQENSAATMWKGDSIQFAIDTEKSGYPSDRIDFQAALTPNGPVLFKEKNPSICGDLPTNWSAPGTVVKHCKFRTEKTENGLRYIIHINKSELYPYAPASGDDIRFSLLINDNDGDGRKGWVEWAAGIGKSKDPTLYGTLKALTP